MNNKRLILLSIFIPILFLTLFEMSIYVKKDELKMTKAILKVRDSNVKCLIVGDSHPMHAFGNELKECVNLSLGGTSIPMNADIVYSVDKNNPLNIVILSIDPHNFAKYRLANYSPVFKNLSISDKFFYTPLLSVSTIKEELKNHIIDIVKGKDTSETWDMKTKEERKKSLEGRLKEHTNIDNFQNTNYAKMYKQMVDYLVNKGIKVYLVRAPVVEKYNEVVLNHVGRNNWKSFISYLTNTGAIYVDYEKLNFDDTVMNNFNDQDHLSEKGSKIFSKIFREEFLE